MDMMTQTASYILKTALAWICSRITSLLGCQSYNGPTYNVVASFGQRLNTPKIFVFIILLKIHQQNETNAKRLHLKPTS